MSAIGFSSYASAAACPCGNWRLEPGVATGMISYVERGRDVAQPVTLQKVLSALGTDLGSFFGAPDGTRKGPVFAREQMRVVADRDRTYTMLLMRRPGIRMEMFDEELRPARKKPDFESLTCDIAGYVLFRKPGVGRERSPAREVAPRDAFYVPRAPLRIAATAAGTGPVAPDTVCQPAALLIAHRIIPCMPRWDWCWSCLPGP